jgi:predicted membrane metal-binding protein
MAGILWAILVIILVVWLIGLLADVAGNAVHLLLLIALAVLIYNFVTGRRTL